MKTLLLIIWLYFGWIGAIGADGGTITFTGAIVNSHGQTFSTQAVITSSPDPLLNYALTRMQGSSIMVTTITYQ